MQRSMGLLNKLIVEVCQILLKTMDLNLLLVKALGEPLTVSIFKILTLNNMGAQYILMLLLLFYGKLEILLML